jgi:hypothetical protein
MHHHAVDDFRRREHQQAVEVQVAFRAAASPPCFLGTDGDSAGLYAEQRRVIRDALRNVCAGTFRQFFDFLTL